MPAHAIEIRGLQKSYKRFTLGPLDLTVPAGAIYGFVGPNGAGKTTTIDLIFGMGGKDAGTITVLGCDHLRDEVAMKRQVGYVSPELNFQPWGTVAGAIHFVRGFYPTWDDGYCERLLASLSVKAAERIGSLSFGARIKLALILALAWRPTLLVLDEPTVGLDAISKRQIFTELLSAVRDEARTVFISSHAISDLERFADHVGMIKDGRLLFEGAIDEVAERFRLVDLISDHDVELVDEPGLLVQQREANRWRVLVDRQSPAAGVASQAGVRVVAETPLSLEDLFIALGRS
jgi:ABC-2 type transport system ATP-binding protein